ncbi:MAG: alpha/beta hydrolase, partial [Gracilimonas sp.]
MKKLILIALLSTLFSTYSLSQDYALFIHGFEGSAESWINSGTPNDWKIANIIDDYVVVSYQTSELKTSTGQQQVISRIVSKMVQKDPTGSANWILVGHSMGGLVARAGYDKIKNNSSTQHFNIKAVITVGAPNQGARATAVSLEPVSGYKNVQPVLNTFVQRTTEPLGDVHQWVGSLTSLAAPDALSQLEKAPELIEDAINKIKYFENASVSNNIKDVIGVNGSLIQDINSGQFSEPSFKRSIIGAEKRFIIVRSANEILGNNSGNEYSTLQNFDDIRWFYKANANAWDTQQIMETILWQFNKAKESRRKRDRWNRGRTALDNIDNTWGIMIDSYKTEYTTIYTWDYVCSGTIFNPPIPPDPYSDPCWEQVPHNVSYDVPTKNDVIVGPDYAVWSPWQNPNDRNINWYYDDIPANG